MKTKITTPASFDTIPKDQQIEYVQELWDQIAKDAEQISIPKEHQKIIDERLNAYHTNPLSGRPWNEVREELLTKLRTS